MSSTAYLLVWIDGTGEKPEVTDVGIYSEGPDSITTADRSLPACFFSVEAPDYHEAHDEMVRILRDTKAFAWVFPWLEKGGDVP